MQPHVPHAPPDPHPTGADAAPARSGDARSDLSQSAAPSASESAAPPASESAAPSASDPALDRLSPEKRQRLAAFLTGLPAGAAMKLFAALEADRAAGGVALPHAALLDILRRAFAGGSAAFPPRPKTAMRLFFTPFEDLFTALRAGPKRAGRIPRAALAPIWAALREDPASTGVGRTADALDALIAGSPAAPTLEEALFNAGAQSAQRLIARAGAEPAFAAGLTARLGGEAGLADLAELAALLPAVHHFRALQAAVPRRAGALDEETLYRLRAIFAAASAETPAAAPGLAYALMGRLEAPWRALRFHYHLAAAADPSLQPAALAAATIPARLFDDLAAAARLLESGGDGEFDADEARLHLDHFADLAEGIFSEALRAGDRAAIARVEAARDVAAGALDRFAEQGLAALRRAMPVRHAGASSRLMALRPDIARPPGPRATLAARRGAEFLAAIGAMAERLDRPAAGRAVAADAKAELARYAGDLVLEIRAGEGEERLAARRLMEEILACAGGLLPADELALLRARAETAALSA